MTEERKTKEKKTINKNKKIVAIDKKMLELVKKVEETRGTRCLLFLSEITPDIVKDVYMDIRKNYKNCGGKLDVFIDSGGGDIDAAYNIATLLQGVASQKLTFIIPRWAKSAATLLVAAGDEILMTDIAELGPLDPQITEINPMESRYETFSPLHLENTLSLIRKEFSDGNKELANKLIERLQFPLTLGSFLKSLEVGERYVKQLLLARMFKEMNESEAEKKSSEIAKRLSTDYADHGYCVKATEGKKMGLKIQNIDDGQIDLIMEIYSLYDEKRKIKDAIKRKSIMEKIKEIPPNLIPPGLLGKIKIDQ